MSIGLGAAAGSATATQRYNEMNQQAFCLYRTDRANPSGFSYSNLSMSAFAGRFCTVHPEEKA